MSESAFESKVGLDELTSQSRRSRVGVSVLDIIDNRREQQHGAGTEETGESYGRHPVGPTGRPCEWEETGGKEECSDEGWRESQLGRNLAVCLVVSRTPPVPERCHVQHMIAVAESSFLDSLVP